MNDIDAAPRTASVRQHRSPKPAQAHSDKSPSPALSPDRTGSESLRRGLHLSGETKTLLDAHLNELMRQVPPDPLATPSGLLAAMLIDRPGLRAHTIGAISKFIDGLEPCARTSEPPERASVRAFSSDEIHQTAEALENGNLASAPLDRLEEIARYLTSSHLPEAERTKRRDAVSRVAFALSGLHKNLPPDKLGPRYYAIAQALLKNDAAIEDSAYHLALMGWHGYTSNGKTDVSAARELPDDVVLECNTPNYMRPLMKFISAGRLFPADPDGSAQRLVTYLSRAVKRLKHQKDSYVSYQEPIELRALAKRAIASAVTEHLAVSGDQRRLLQQIVTECETYIPPTFLRNADALVAH